MRRDARPVRRTDLSLDISAGQHDSMPRNFGMLSIIGLAYTVLNSWTAMATSMSTSLFSGGPSAILWGIAPAFIGNLCMAASLGEPKSIQSADRRHL